MRSQLSLYVSKGWRQTCLLFAAVLMALSLATAFTPARVSAGPVFAATVSCKPSGGSFLGFPPWHKYLDGVKTDFGCTPRLRKLSDVWLIGLAGLEILLRLVALLAIVFVLYGGVKLITSQGDPSNTKQARETIMNALIGLVIAVSATAIVSFVAGRFT